MSKKATNWVQITLAVYDLMKVQSDEDLKAFEESWSPEVKKQARKDYKALMELKSLGVFL